MFFRIHAVRGVDHVELEFGAHDPNKGKKFWCGPLWRLKKDGTFDRLIEDLQRFKGMTPRKGDRRPKATPTAAAVAEVPQAPESAPAVPAAQSGEEVKEEQ